MRNYGFIRLRPDDFDPCSRLSQTVFPMEVGKGIKKKKKKKKKKNKKKKKKKKK